MNFHPVDGLFLLFEGDVDIGGRIQPVIEVQRMRVLHHQLYRPRSNPCSGMLRTLNQSRLTRGDS